MRHVVIYVLFFRAKDGEATLLRRTGSHSHAEETEDRIRRATRSEMKNMTRCRPDKSCKDVYDEVLASSFGKFRGNRDIEEIAGVLPTYNSVHSSLQRSRTRVRPNLPKTRADIRLEGSMACTKDGDAFFCSTRTNLRTMSAKGSSDSAQMKP